jgi:GNAT superfamily N-acetyltransferase
MDELQLEIHDEYENVGFFDIDMSYKDYHADKMLNTVYISINDGTGIIAYMECVVFYDDKIYEYGANVFLTADSELTSDASEAIYCLQEYGYYDNDDTSEVSFLISSGLLSTVYIHHLAVRDDYRKRGIGSWLIRNMKDIVATKCNVDIGVAVIKLFPEIIKWGTGMPKFTAGDETSEPTFDESGDNNKLALTMKKLLENNGYTRYKDTLIFIQEFINDND